TPLFSSPSCLAFARAHRDPHSFPTRRSSDLRIRAGREADPLVLAQAPDELRNLRLRHRVAGNAQRITADARARPRDDHGAVPRRSEEHTSELQSRENLVCRLLLEKKKKKNKP